MKILLDMNLSPAWVGFLEGHAFETVHWVSVGPPTAPDSLLMTWAREQGFVVMTHDLDFAALLAAAGAAGPSVVQIRTQNVLPDAIGDTVVAVLREHRTALERGAIISIDELRSRIRVLPIPQP
jgi:predicted nuclease of predicted toxin-antitoxin system